MACCFQLTCFLCAELACPGPRLGALVIQGFCPSSASKFLYYSVLPLEAGAYSAVLDARLAHSFTLDTFARYSSIVAQGDQLNYVWCTRYQLLFEDETRFHQRYMAKLLLAATSYQGGGGEQAFC